MTTPAPYEYAGQLVRAIDGDTVVLKLTKDFVLNVDLGFHILQELRATMSTEQSFRLNGINTPEMVGALHAAAVEAKTALEQKLATAVKPLRVLSYKADKYGRWLCDIFLTDASGVEILVNEWMIDHGYAKPYTGEGPKPV